MVRRYPDKPVQGFVEFGIFLSLLNVFSELLPLFRVGKRFVSHNITKDIGMSRYLKLTAVMRFSLLLVPSVMPR